jgi:hypothetical protein
MPYYACYGDLEHAQFQKASLWLRNNRYLTYRPPLLELTRWDRTRFSIKIVSLCIRWIFMAPMVVYFILIHLEPPIVECPRNRKIYATISFVMVSLNKLRDLPRSLILTWKANFFLLGPQIFSMLSVLYRSCRGQYHGNDWPLMILQGSFCLFAISGACYLCIILHTRTKDAVSVIAGV